MTDRLNSVQRNALKAYIVDVRSGKATANDWEFLVHLMNGDTLALFEGTLQMVTETNGQQNNNGEMNFDSETGDNNNRGNSTGLDHTKIRAHAASILHMVQKKEAKRVRWQDNPPNNDDDMPKMDDEVGDIASIIRDGGRSGIVENDGKPSPSVLNSIFTGPTEAVTVLILRLVLLLIWLLAFGDDSPATTALQFGSEIDFIDLDVDSTADRAMPQEDDDAVTHDNMAGATAENRVSSDNTDPTISLLTWRLTVLLSYGVSDMYQKSNQKSTIDLLTDCDIPYDVVDGMDIDQKSQRDELFQISGIRGNYPQIFLTTSTYHSPDDATSPLQSPKKEHDYLGGYDWLHDIGINDLRAIVDNNRGKENVVITDNPVSANDGPSASISLPQVVEDEFDTKLLEDAERLTELLVVRQSSLYDLQEKQVESQSPFADNAEEVLQMNKSTENETDDAYQNETLTEASPLVKLLNETNKMDDFDEFLKFEAVMTKANAALRSVSYKDARHFDLTQNLYGATKVVWSWGKTVPLLSNLLGMTEFIALKALDTTLHMDFAQIDEGLKTQLKMLDDKAVTPAVSVVWRVIEPAMNRK